MPDSPFAADDVANNIREVRKNIAASLANRPKVDANGYPIGAPSTYEYDEFGRLIKVTPGTEPPAA
jgi:hypothetical protein